MGFITGQPDTGTSAGPICPGSQSGSFIDLTDSFDNVGFAVVLTSAQASLCIFQVPFCRRERLILQREGEIRPCDQLCLVRSPSGKFV